VSDEAVYAATQRAMMRRGPGELSLGEIASEAGLTPGALVQRFGSKRELLLAVVADWAEGQAALLEEFRGTRASPVERLLYYGECMAAMGETPGALAHHLSYLQMDLTDPDFQRHMRRSAEVTRGVLREWLEEAVSAGELSAEADPGMLARAFETALGGSLLNWAVYQDGPAAAWVREDLEAVLAPWRGGR
jgi:AcrR family transcriptional regulator